MVLDTAKIRKQLIGFIRTEVTKAGFRKGIVGLSGGVDSALVVYLAVEALGKENVMALLLPYKTSNPDSLRDALEVVKLLGIRSETIDITPMVDAYLSKAGKVNQVRKGNIMARQRMIVLYDVSAREEALVIGTSNKTESLLGYGTLFGDTACAINPIGDLYKTQIWQMAEAVGVQRKIIDKEPTADLWAGQSDEGELGFAYRQVDLLLHAMVTRGESDEKLKASGFDPAFIGRVKDLIRRNEFKRRPPLIARLS
jgi:NAD+ synthase